jgi:hypothetical protein
MTDKPLDWLTGLMVGVGTGQLAMFYWQLRTMKETAKLALLALDRPYLVVEDFHSNESKWKNGGLQLCSGFRIHNYGKVPAIIKSMHVAHFRGPHHHDGRPPRDVMVLPDNVLELPNADNFFRFVADNSRRLYNSPTTQLDKLNIVIPSDKISQDFTFIGYHPLEIPESDHGMSPLSVTESYMLGWIFYEVPGQESETLTFTYRIDPVLGFITVRDYPPFNERKRIASELSTNRVRAIIMINLRRLKKIICL